MKLLSVSPNAQYLETDPNNNDTDGDGLSDGAEDANHNGIVDLAIIDRNQDGCQRQLCRPGDLLQSDPVGDGARLNGRLRHFRRNGVSHGPHPINVRWFR